MDLVPLDPVSLTSLHALAEHVLTPALYQATERIDLLVSPGGFSTPPFGDDGRVIRVDGTTLVVGPPDHERRTPLTTLAAAADLAGIEPGAPTSVFTPTTACDPDAPLDIDPAFAHSLAGWYALGDAALHRWATDLSPDDPAPVILWPEHFDVAIAADDVNYGASPGDETEPAPYVYVGPAWELVASLAASDPFWNAPFGALRRWDEIATVDEAVSFFRAGHERLHNQ